MPSPIAHLAAGYAVYRVFCRSERQACTPTSLLIAAEGFSLLPDIDLLPSFVLGKRWWKFHRELTHSVSAGILAALCAAFLGRIVFRTSFTRLFVLTTLTYTSHIVLDAFTPGKGVMFIWPFQSTRYRSPISLFYGFRWSRGMMNPHHLGTALSELAFCVLVWRGAQCLVHASRLSATLDNFSNARQPTHS